MSGPLSPEDVRAHMPYVNRYIYVDSGATTPTPRPVLDAISDYMDEYGVNVERGAYSLAQMAMERWDEAREHAARLLLNCHPDDFVFTKGTTEGPNIVAHALEHRPLTTTEKEFDFLDPIIDWRGTENIVSTVMEHHSNLLPWMRLAKRVGVEFRTVEPTKDCVLLPERFEELVDGSTALVAFQHVSNGVGTIHPVKDIVSKIRSINSECLIFIDGSQGPGHVHVDVKDIDCDFYAFSGHKGPLGPPGSGALYGKRELLMAMEPMNVGGGVIADVSRDSYKIRTDVPAKRFDAGTPNIIGLVGLGRGAQYVMEEIGIERVEEREKALGQMLIEGVQDVTDLQVYGPPLDSPYRGGVVTFNIKGWRCHDLSSALDEKWKILTRAGHHCCMPLIKWLGIWDEYGGNDRASFGYFNLESEVEAVIDALRVLGGAK